MALIPMNKATITFSDSLDGDVDLNVDFGEGFDDASQAHHMASKALVLVLKHIRETDYDSGD